MSLHPSNLGLNEIPGKSFAYYFQLSKNRWCPEILDDASLERLLRLASCFPGDISTFWGLECRLGEASKKADLLFEIKKNSSGHAWLKDRENPVSSKLRQRSPIWKLLIDFADNWGEQHSLHSRLRNIWLEFDTAAIDITDAMDNALAYPSIFWGPEANAEADGGFLPTLESIAATLLRGKVASGLPDLLRKSMPVNAQIFQLGVMSSREEPVIRVCVNRFAYDDLIPFLKRLKWPGRIDSLSLLLKELKPLVKSVALDFDIGPSGIGEKIGLECYLDWESLDVGQWLPLLEFLTARGLLLPEKQTGLLKFPKKDAMEIKAQLNDESNATVYQYLYQNIHHIKLTFINSELLEAKAYLGVYRPGLNRKLFECAVTDGRVRLPDDHWIIP